ncbi:Kcnh2 [Symbiodinium sp. KB8]|nr:Kcnh2 [Symbiodinium sp. KB8]
MLVTQLVALATMTMVDGTRVSTQENLAAAKEQEHPVSGFIDTHQARQNERILSFMASLQEEQEKQLAKTKEFVQTLLQDDVAETSVPPTTTTTSRVSLEMAAWNGDVAALAAWRQAGYNLSSVIWTNHDGNTPAHYAARNGHVAALKFLQEAGADLQKVNLNHRTPAHMAAYNGKVDTLRLLIEAGVNLNVKDRGTEADPGGWGQTKQTVRPPWRLRQLAEAVIMFVIVLSTLAWVIMILTTISLRSTSVGAALALTLFALPLSLAEPDMSDMNRENPAIRVLEILCDSECEDLEHGRRLRVGPEAPKNETPATQLVLLATIAMVDGTRVSIQRNLAAAKEQEEQLAEKEDLEAEARGQPPDISLELAAKTGDVAALAQHGQAGSHLDEKLDSIADGQRRTMPSNASPPYTAPVAGRCQLECDELFPEWLQNAGLPAGQAKALEALAEARADLQTPGDDGLTPAHAAAKHCKVDALRVLIQEALQEALAQELQKALSPELAALREELRVTGSSTVAASTPRLRRKLSNASLVSNSSAEKISSRTRRPSLLALIPKQIMPITPQISGLPRSRTASVASIDNNLSSSSHEHDPRPTSYEHDPRSLPSGRWAMADTQSTRSDQEDSDEDLGDIAEDMAGDHKEAEYDNPTGGLRASVRRILPTHSVEIPGRRRKLRFSRYSWPFTDPGGRPRQYWEIFACTLLLLQLLYICFQTSFITFDDYQDQGYWELKLALLAVDVFWVIDLGINFTTGYRDATHVLHSSARSNARRYFQLLVVDPPTYGVWFFGLTPLVRAVRFRGAYTLLSRLEANMTPGLQLGKSSVLSSAWWLFQLFMLPIVFSHLSACALWSLGHSNLEADPDTPSWIKLGLDISNAVGNSPGERYTTAMYFAITVMSTVGLGDISMSLSNERALLCVVMATTSLVVGVAVNGVSTIVSKLSERTAANMEQLAQVSKFLKVYRVPRELQSRVHDYLLQVFQNREREETKSMLMAWLKKSEVLRTKVNLALTGTCLVQHRWLKLLPTEVLANVCDLCDMQFHPPQQELIAEGAMVKSCFYIRSGSVQTRNRVEGQAWAATSGDDTEESDEIQKEIEAADAASPDARLQGGAFIGESRLFLGASRSFKTVTCLSFCELISIDVSKFESLMSEAMPELFDILVIYAAIDHDCPKVNAAACAEHLIRALGEDAAQVRDQDGMSPAQLAAALKHKKAFWAMIQGSRGGVTEADVLPREDSQAITPSAWTDRDEEPYTMADVQQLFASCNRKGLAASRGEGSKGMEDLVEELNTCQSDLLVMNVRGGMQQTLLRRVRLVRLRLLAVIDDNVHALVELNSDAWLRARDQKLGKLPYRRMQKNETEEEATKSLMQELGISAHLLEEKMVVPIAKSCHVETRTSMSYPGLETEYIVYASTWKVRAHALDKTAEIGLPLAEPFTKEFCTPTFHMLSRQFFWPVLLNFAAANQGPGAPSESFRGHQMPQEDPDSGTASEETPFPGPGTYPQGKVCRRLRMGGKRTAWKKSDQRQGQDKWDEKWSSSGPPWHVWRGAWSPRNVTDRYDAVALPSSSSGTERAGTVPQGTGQGDLMREVQKNLSAARRADTRVRKLGEEKVTRGAKWEKWAREAKEKFLRQRRQYEEDLARIDEAIASTTQEGQKAAQMVQNLVAHGMAAKQQQQPAEAEALWDSMVAEPEDATMESGFMRDALLAAARAGAHVPQQTGAMATPDAAARLLAQAMQYMPGMAAGLITAANAPAVPVAPEGALPSTAPPGLAPPPEHGHPPPSHRSDMEGHIAATTAPLASNPGPGAPYHGSPDHRVDLMKAAPSGNNSASPHLPARVVQRQPVKGAPLRPVHSGTGVSGGLAGKLEARRSALEPFGSAPAPPGGFAFTVNGRPQNVPVEDLEIDEELDLLETPDASSVDKTCGIKVGDDIKVDGSTALVLFAEADDLQEFTSDAYDHDLLAGAADPVEQRLDLAAEYSTWEDTVGMQGHPTAMKERLSGLQMLSLSLSPLQMVDEIISERIIDSYGCGYWASGVLVATEEISPVPCPPALQPETRLILILDQRRILRGFKWHLVPRRLVKVQDIADRFYDICPFRHTVSIRGAEVEEHDSERYFSIVHGQVLVIDFTLETDDAAEDEAPPWDQSPDDHPGRPYLAWAQSDLEPDGGDDGNSGAPFSHPSTLCLDDDSQEDVQEFGSFVDVAFYLLTPGYIVEQVDMSIVVPQLVGDVLDLVQTCRLAEGRQKFPVLVPVEPQPDPGWGVLLALPAWLRHRTVICLDLSLFDGRIISVDVPANLDFHVLCESAGLSPHAGVDIYLPGAQEPLLRGADCLLWTGACVAFRRPGARRHVGFDLEAMLATRAGWEHSPVFPRDRLDNGYCVVSQQGERLFRLQPERAFYYKADIALLTGLHPLRVIVTPASSQPDDVSVNGWVCRAVVAATDRQERYNWDGSIDTPTICILDCRAAFLGWGVVHTWEPWIDLEPIRHSLNQSAPDGWCAAFPGFPSHWTWACVEPGQLIVVFCA